MVDQSKGVGLKVSYLAENSLVEGFDYEFQAKALGKEDRPMVEHNPPLHADRVPLIPSPIALYTSDGLAEFLDQIPGPLDDSRERPHPRRRRLAVPSESPLGPAPD